MDQQLLIISTVCFLAAVVRTVVLLRAKNFHAGRFNFLAIGLGFIFQTAFLSIRGHALGRCPLTNLFEVFIFLAWSIALIYMLIGPSYRLSLMGAFTAPLVFVIQTFALLARIDNVRIHPEKLGPAFPRMPSGRSAAISDISIANQMNLRGNAQDSRSQGTSPMLGAGQQPTIPMLNVILG